MNSIQNEFRCQKIRQIYRILIFAYANVLIEKF